MPDYKLITIDEKPFEIIRKAVGSANGISRSEEKIQKLEVTPIRVMHYRLPILGFRIGNLAYITDGSSIPEEEFEKLKDLEVLIINTVRHEKHISHFSLPEALEIIRRVGAPQNYLTHLSHQIGSHAQLTEILEKFSKSQPENSRQEIFAAYDGLKVRF